MIETERALSAVLIAHDNEDRIAACLRSLAFADEIVVVDSHSTDATRAIAERHGARVIDEAWRGFGPQKRFAVDAATNDWVFSIDTDEVVTPTLAAAIVDALKAPTHAAYEVARMNRFMGRDLKHGEGFPDWTLRLFDRRQAHWSDDVVHEKVETRSPVGRLPLDAILSHRSAESLATYLDKQNRYTSLQAEALHREGRRASAWKMLFSPALRFVRLYLFKLGFLDGIPGLVHIAIGCFNTFAKNAKLRALEVEQDQSTHDRREEREPGAASTPGSDSLRQGR